LSGAVAAIGGLARIDLARNDAEGAAEQALSALELVRSKDIWVWTAEVAPVATEALAAVGRKSDAADLVAEIAKGLRRRDAPAAHAALSFCRALLLNADGHFEQAARGFARAERAWLALSRPYEAGRCREARGLSLLSLGDGRGEALVSGAL